VRGRADVAARRTVRGWRGASLRERGAAAVEMALILPLLVVLALGVVEAAWAFSQQQAARGLAREAMRVATNNVTIDLDSQTIALVVCDDEDLVNQATVEASGVGVGPTPSPANYVRGQRAYIEVNVPYTSLTGFVPGFDGVTITERVVFASEAVTQPFWWPQNPGNPGRCPP
jgi:Flp pilus assembly protein TadG